ncbi:MAG TPA: RuBisCO large subunit C-terminal-like domain-containing protein, partial [Rhodothermales bacterium]|nr:RuBisCO large subunit C-terminal-like domain-containing protein [Rhodothermales bacterium]
MENVEVTYRIRVPEDRISDFAESVMLEQSVETPLNVALRYPYVRERMLGHVVNVTPEPESGFRVSVALPAETASVDPAQLLNVLFGNSSLHEEVELLDFNLPPSVKAGFSGPRFGIDGIRRRTGVSGRPLTCTALKPVGLTVAELADLCLRFAEGGIDVIKDDHYLSDHPFSPFEERVQACQHAVDDVAERTGHRAVYCPNLSGTPGQVFRQAAFAQDQGVGAVMAAPMLLGMPFFFDLVRNHLEIPILAHPSFAGAQRIREDTLQGKLFRLFGADAVIFANYGGRFNASKETCAATAAALRAEWPPYAASLPVPAGGMTAAR